MSLSVFQRPLPEPREAPWVRSRGAWEGSDHWQLTARVGAAFPFDDVDIIIVHQVHRTVRMVSSFNRFCGAKDCQNNPPRSYRPATAMEIGRRPPDHWRQHAAEHDWRAAQQPDWREYNNPSLPVVEDIYDAAEYAPGEVCDILTTRRPNRDSVPLKGVTTP